MLDSLVDTSLTVSASYGGTVDPLPIEPLPLQRVHYNQGIGNGAEGGDPGRSRPHGGSNDEMGQLPGSRSGGYASVQDVASTSNLVDSAGYGGTVDPLPIEPTPVLTVHFNQGIGNGAEGGDPGRSQPHGSSNDELGQVPGSYRGGVLGQAMDSSVRKPEKVLMGTSRQDRLQGGNGDDLLTGAGGNDTLVGSGGCDQFVYDTGKGFSMKDVGSDMITDFIAGTDKILLSKSTFAMKSGVGSFFSVTSDFSVVATDAAVARSSGAIVFSTESHGLFYNENRGAEGLGVGGKFATIAGAHLGANDFMIQA